MMGAADGNGDGNVSFAEFVTYAKQNLALFGKSARPHAELLLAASLLLKSPDLCHLIYQISWRVRSLAPEVLLALPVAAEEQVE